MMTGVAITLAAVPATFAAEDESTNRVAEETDWSVFVESDPKECFVVSAPKDVVNTRDGKVVSARRGDILLFVFFRPGAGIDGQVSFTGGYPFASGSTVNMNIGGTTFELFTEGEWAWPASPADDAKVVNAMKRGTDAVMRARSGRPTDTKDTFSLLGFTAAYEDAKKRCSG